MEYWGLLAVWWCTDHQHVHYIAMTLLHKIFVPISSAARSTWWQLSSMACLDTVYIVMLHVLCQEIYIYINIYSSLCSALSKIGTALNALQSCVLDCWYPSHKIEILCVVILGASLCWTFLTYKKNVCFSLVQRCLFPSIRCTMSVSTRAVSKNTMAKSLLTVIF